MAGTFTLTQTGLIEKIAGITGLTHSSANKLPAPQVALGSDPDGEPIKEKWNFASVVSMLLYLSANTRPDIAYAVSQVALLHFEPQTEPCLNRQDHCALSRGYEAVRNRDLAYSVGASHTRSVR
jgi:hypothetical protein